MTVGEPPKLSAQDSGRYPMASYGYDTSADPTQTILQVANAGMQYDEAGRITGYDAGSITTADIGGALVTTMASHYSISESDMNYGSDFATFFGQEYARTMHNNVIGAASGWANRQLGSENRLIQQFGVQTALMGYSAVKGLFDSDPSPEALERRASREANENDQNRRTAGLFQGWQFWRDEEGGDPGSVVPGKTGGRSLDVARLIRNGELDPRKLQADENGNFILSDGSVLTRAELNELLYSSAEPAKLMNVGYAAEEGVERKETPRREIDKSNYKPERKVTREELWKQMGIPEWLGSIGEFIHTQIEMEKARHQRDPNGRPMTAYEAASDRIHEALDWLGLTPGVGIVFDVANGIYHAGEALLGVGTGSWLGAGLSILAAVPFMGQVATGSKIGKKALKYGDDMAEAATKYGDDAVDAMKAKPKNWDKMTRGQQASLSSRMGYAFESLFFKRSGLAKNTKNTDPIRLPSGKPARVRPDYSMGGGASIAHWVPNELTEGLFDLKNVENFTSKNLDQLERMAIRARAQDVPFSVIVGPKFKGNQLPDRLKDYVKESKGGFFRYDPFTNSLERIGP